jgi:hypothetical protein
MHFNVPRHGRIPSRNTTLLWVHNFSTTASAKKKKQDGSEQTVRIPENVEAVRNGVEQSPRRSAVSHAQALRLSDTTVRRILHQDLNFHLFKNIPMVFLNCNIFCVYYKKKNHFFTKSDYALLVKPSGFTGGT